jgi:hypothetical protein
VDTAEPRNLGCAATVRLTIHHPPFAIRHPWGGVSIQSQLGALSVEHADSWPHAWLHVCRTGSTGTTPDPELETATCHGPWPMCPLKRPQKRLQQRPQSAKSTHLRCSIPGMPSARYLFHLSSDTPLFVCLPRCLFAIRRGPYAEPSALHAMLLPSPATRPRPMCTRAAQKQHGDFGPTESSPKPPTLPVIMPALDAAGLRHHWAGRRRDCWTVGNAPYT